MSGSRMVVGARGTELPGNQNGSAYVYDLGSTPPSRLVTLGYSDSQTLGFGDAVAISGTRVAVGAPFFSTPGLFSVGRVYVYDLNSGTPGVPVVTLANPGPNENDSFGAAVAVSDSFIVVGAPFDDSWSTTDAGHVYVFNAAGQWMHQLANPQRGDGRFGSSVAISGTLLAVGAPGWVPDVGANTGTVYVFDLAGASPEVPLATLRKPNPAAYDYFGSRVAISGMRVVTGPQVYVFDLTNGPSSIAMTRLRNPERANEDLPGSGLAISGNRVVVGTSSDTPGGAIVGNAFVFDLSGGAPAYPVAKLRKRTPAPGDDFGFAVATDGNIVLVGAPFDSSLVAGKGFAYLFGPNPLDEDSDGLRDSWELTHWSTTTGHAAPDDFDHDGYSELLELAFGLNPTVADPGGLPPVIIEGGYLTMTLTKQAGVSYEVQSGGTLPTGLPGSFSAAGTTVLVNDAVTLKVRDNAVIGTVPTRFLRVKVTAAP